MITGSTGSGLEVVNIWKRWMSNIVLPYFNELSQNQNFRHDFVDFTRAALSNWFNIGVADVLNNCVVQGSLVDKCGLFESNCTGHLKQILQDLNTVLQCSEHFMFGVEEQSALKRNPHSKTTTILNVRNQRTMWGPCKYKTFSRVVQ